jgi:hypothetical protein
MIFVRREAISSTAGGFLPPMADLTEKSKSCDLLFSAKERLKGA